MNAPAANRSLTRRFSVAPMMEWTDRHCRFFHRQLTRHALLYTEMLTADAIIHGPRERLLGFDAAEHPVALQLGGSHPKNLAQAATIGADFGYDEINLNVGCPSDRVQDGRFGACLMRDPKLVGECVAAMKAAVALPITVKCRLGVDDQDIEESLDRFADTVIAAGADALIVHARKAWLDGLSPRENRDIPPLDHARVHRLKRRLNDFPIIINGGIHTLDEAEDHLRHVDGVMLGRAAYQNPGMLLHARRGRLDTTSNWHRRRLSCFFGVAAPVSETRAAFVENFARGDRADMLNPSISHWAGDTGGIAY